MNHYPVRHLTYLKQVFLLLLLVLLGFPSSLYAQKIAGPGRDSAELTAAALEQGHVRVIVELDAPFQPEGRFRFRTSVQQQRAAIAEQQARVLDQIASTGSELIAAWETIPFMAMVVDVAGLNVLQRSPSVINIQEDRLDSPLLDGSSVHIGAPKAWAVGYDGGGQMVVILDTGIDRRHSFFGDRVVEEACFSNESALGSGDGVSLCPGGASTETGIGAADVLTEECTVGLVNRNRCWHGTHVAGVAAGANSGDTGLNGIARGSDIGAIQVCTYVPTSATSGSIDCYASDQISALEYVLTVLHPLHDIASVNISLGGEHFSDQALCDAENLARKAAIDNLRAVGIPTIIASGNSSELNAIAEPACISSAVAVSGSTDPYDAIWASSSIHNMVELMAPGSKITSALPTTYSYGYYESSGTSFAAPHVAGAWAILKQAIEDLEVTPDTSVDRILTLLQNTGVPIDDTRGGGVVTDVPRIDLCAALTDLGVTGSVELSAKVLLQGAFRDVASGSGYITDTLMRDTLRTLEVADGFQGDFLPHSEPYAAQFGFSQGETIADPATVLADYAGNSIVDWIYLELRDETSPATILATRAALLQRDGDVVDVDGTSPVAFDCTLPGDYYVAARHRNHLGAMTAMSVTLAATGSTVDFTDTVADFWHNDAAYDGYEQETLDGRFVLWGGNADSDSTIDYAAADGDSPTVDAAVLGTSSNLLGSLGYHYSGYHAEDVDMDGQVIASGVGNEHDLILRNVLYHALNGSNAQDFVVVEQLAHP